jgi:MoxR-like ATPase
MREKIVQLKDEISKVVIGQEGVVDSLILGLLCDGHVLLEGLPGLAKTTVIKTLASAIGVNFKRVQFTPDLLPSDIIGTQIYNQTSAKFDIKHGPVFTNLLLADEINRAPAKVQSALLEAMQERQVTIANKSFRLTEPFLVLATQNPIESEGAYQLPEAQLDRFMFKSVATYNTKQEELQIAKMQLTNQDSINQVINYNDIKAIKQQISQIHVDAEVEEYMINLIFATRFPSDYGLDELIKYIHFGASPRASIDLFKVVRARAYMDNKDFVSPIDIAKVLKDILRHRIVLTYEAQADDINPDYIIDEVISNVDIP